VALWQRRKDKLRQLDWRLFLGKGIGSFSRREKASAYCVHGAPPERTKRRPHPGEAKLAYH
jgi:hypothetical protein